MSRFIYRSCLQNYLYVFLSTWVEQNAWPGNRVVKCADAYKCRRKCFVFTKYFSSVRPSYGLRPSNVERRYAQTYECVWTRIPCQTMSDMLWDAATCGGTLNYKHDEPTSFFFVVSISFLLVARVLCSKPVGLPPCVSKGIFFHVCLRRLVLERNKTYDREIALWNARMRIYFDANLWEMNFEENSLSMLNMVSGTTTPGPWSSD